MLSKILTRAGDLGAVHAQLPGLQLESLCLLIGHLLEGFLDQIDPCLLHIFSDASSEIVQRAQFEMPLLQISIAQGIAHLHVIAKGIVQLFIAPAKARFERFQPH
jgi:hypothetical protein